MHLALRPYVTTGVALVGATVIAAAPITPTPPDVRVANPVVQAIEREVQLAGLEIEEAINNAIYAFVARPTVAGAELLGRLLEPIIGEEQATLLPLAALGFAGPLISGGGSVGTALQTIVDSEGFEELLSNLIGGLDPAFQVWLTRSTSEERKGSILGFAMTAKSLGWVIASVSSAYLATVTGIRSIFLLAAALFLVLIPLSAYASAKVGRDKSDPSLP